MSKGCLIALIIVGVLLVMIVVAGVVCYLNRGQLAKFGVSAVITEVKKKFAEHPSPGVDTVQIDKMADAFVAEMEQGKETDFERVGRLVQALQHMSSKEALDSTDAAEFYEILIEHYPKLKDLMPATVPVDTAAVDSSAVGVD
jgi:hypothetical protein